MMRHGKAAGLRADEGTAVEIELERAREEGACPLGTCPRPSHGGWQSPPLNLKQCPNRGEKVDEESDPGQNIADSPGLFSPGSQGCKQNEGGAGTGARRRAEGPREFARLPLRLRPTRLGSAAECISTVWARVGERVQRRLRWRTLGTKPFLMRGPWLRAFTYKLSSSSARWRCKSLKAFGCFLQPRTVFPKDPLKCQYPGRQHPIFSVHRRVGAQLLSAPGSRRRTASRHKGPVRCPSGERQPAHRWTGTPQSLCSSS